MANEYRIMTDSSCDLPEELVREYELRVLPLRVTLGEETYFNEPGAVDSHTFYEKLRAGVPAKTSAVNTQAFLDAMKEELDAGRDVLYIGFSSGLSGTYSAGEMAAQSLRPQYPDRKILTVDSLCASLGQGLLVHLCVQKKREGLPIEQVAQFAEDTKLHIGHWFTVTDLHHLHRGGRVSATVAILGTALQIKPVMHMDDAGTLQPFSKVRGRKASMREIVKMVGERIVEPEKQTMFLSHGDCPEEAQALADMLKQQLGVPEVIIGPVGPVIGAHSGPGTLALFFLGEHR